MLVTHQRPSERLQPTISSLDHLSRQVSSQVPTVVPRRLLEVLTVRREQESAALGESITQGVVVVRAVGEQDLGNRRIRRRIEQRFEQLILRDVRRGDDRGRRTTIRPRPDHRLHPIAALGVADFVPPFFCADEGSVDNPLATSLPTTLFRFGKRRDRRRVGDSRDRPLDKPPPTTRLRNAEILGEILPPSAGLEHLDDADQTAFVVSPGTAPLGCRRPRRQ